MKITAQQLEQLKNNEDIHTGNIWIRSGLVGIGIYKRLKYEYQLIAHCNYFRELSLNDINQQLKQPV